MKTKKINTDLSHNVFSHMLFGITMVFIFFQLGCASPQLEWYKTNGGPIDQEDLKQNGRDCFKIASAKYPEQKTLESYKDIDYQDGPPEYVTICKDSPYGASKNERECTTKSLPGKQQMVPVTKQRTVDANSEKRHNLLMQCMQKQGYDLREMK